MPRKQRWQNIADTITMGGSLTVCSEGRYPAISNLVCDHQLVCMMESSGMDFEEIMDRIDKMAKRFHDEGIVTDDVNGTEECIW